MYIPQKRRPSYKNGFAPRDGVSANPGLWKGCRGLWFPGLGISGNRIFDWSGFGHNLALTGPSGNPTWDLIPGHGYGLMCDGSTNEQYANGTFSGISNYPLSLWQFARVDGTAALSSSMSSGIVVGSASNSYLGIGWTNNSTHAIVARNTSFLQGSGGSFSIGDVMSQVGLFRTATDRELYVDGVSTAIHSSSVAIPTLSSIEFGRLAFASNNLGDATNFACGIWDRELTVNEMKILSVDPFAMVRLAPRFSFAAPAAAAASLLITGTVQDTADEDDFTAGGLRAIYTLGGGETWKKA